MFSPDLRRAIEFYRDVLGCSLLEEGVDFASLKASDVVLDIYACGQATTCDQYSTVAGIAAGLYVNCLDQAMSRLKAQGVHFLHSVPAENERMRYAAFKDPFGVIFELIELKSGPQSAGREMG